MLKSVVAKASWKLALSLCAFFCCANQGMAQGILKSLEPGIGYSQFKQWAIENKLVFEAFTKDSLVARESGLLRLVEQLSQPQSLCGG